MYKILDYVSDNFIGFAGAAGTVLLSFLGGWDIKLQWLFVLFAVDIITGTIVAIRGKSSKTVGGGLSSTVAWNGMTRKIITIMIIVVAVGADTVFSQVINTNGICRNAAIGYYLAVEGLSIIENALVMQTSVPAFLKKMFESLKTENDTIEVTKEKETKETDEV